jgi:transposase
MKKEKRQFDRAFKVMAVELCFSGKPTGEVAEELGIRADLLSRWKREYKQQREGSFSGHGKASLPPEQAEIAKLRKQLRKAEIERDILKKAVSIFSRNDGRSTLL